MCQFIIYKIAQTLALLLPIRAGYSVAKFIAILQFRFSKKDREVVLDNLRAVLKTDDEAVYRRVGKEVFINFAKYLVDFFRFSKLDKNYIASNVKFVGKDNLDKALRRGKGVIALTAHLGNYELGGAIVALCGYPFNAVALDHQNKLVNNFFIRQRQVAKINVIAMGAALKKCYKCLTRGEVLALLGDRDFTNHGIRVKFFGRDTSIPKGPAVLSLRTGALIVPTFIIRTPDDTFQFTFEKPISYNTTDDFEDDVRRIIESYLKVIEEHVRKYPSQWFMFRRFWI